MHNLVRKTLIDRRSFIGARMPASLWEPRAGAYPPLAGEARRGRSGGPVREPIVQLGSATEGLNRSWYERNTGRLVTDVQRT